MKKFVKASIFVPANGENARLIGIDFGNNEKPFGKVVEVVDSEAIRERDELIRDLRLLGTCDIDCDGLRCSKTCKKKSMLFEKARKLTEEVK